MNLGGSAECDRRGSVMEDDGLLEREEICACRVEADTNESFSRLSS